jgi:bacterioferritin (cytochrome b1)
MFFWNTLKKTLRQWALFLAPNGRQELLALLADEYLEEAKSSLQLRGHAERMRYPHFRERLSHIADDEERHAAWLGERIASLGGSLPRLSFASREGGNSWENLRLDLDEEKHCIWNLEERLMKIDRLNPEIASGLRQILEDEIRHRDEITDMLVRSDPQAAPPV